MKIAVTRCDGDTEILILNEPVRVQEGCIGGQAMIHSAEGMDHFFRLSDGKYDGYGMGAPDQGWTEEQAKTLIDAAHGQRQIIPVTIRGIIAVRIGKARQYAWWYWNHWMRRPGF